MLKASFLDEPLEDVVTLATDIFHTFQDDGNKLLKRLLKKKEIVFTKPFAHLTAKELLDNWDKYK